MKGFKLVVIDMQKDFYKLGSLEVPFAHEIVGKINTLLTLPFEVRIATQDWHPRGHVSFASTHQKEPFTSIQINGKVQELWPDHCIQNTPGSSFIDDIRHDLFDVVSQKGSNIGIDSYSAARQNNGEFIDKFINFFLPNDKIFICGLALDYCVFHTASDLAKLNFNVYLIEDLYKRN